MTEAVLKKALLKNKTMLSQQKLIRIKKTKVNELNYFELEVIYCSIYKEMLFELFQI